MDSFKAALLASFGVDPQQVAMTSGNLTIDTFDEWAGSIDAAIQPTTFCRADLTKPTM